MCRQGMLGALIAGPGPGLAARSHELGARGRAPPLSHSRDAVRDRRPFTCSLQCPIARGWRPRVTLAASGSYQEECRGRSKPPAVPSRRQALHADRGDSFGGQAAKVPPTSSHSFGFAVVRGSCGGGEYGYGILMAGVYRYRALGRHASC